MLSLSSVLAGFDRQYCVTGGDQSAFAVSLAALLVALPAAASAQAVASHPPAASPAPTSGAPSNTEQAVPSTSPAASPTPATAAPSDSEEDEAVDEVVVTARRTQPGAVVGDVKPELQIGRAMILSFGVNTVSELLDELAPQVGSDKGRGTEPPVVLLNGRRISGMSEVRDIPAEAIARVDILPEEAALKYGYAPDQRVVNIVLRRRFQAVSADVKGLAATDGGDEGGEAEVDLFRIRKGVRTNFDLKYQQTSAVTEAQRDVTAFPQAHPFALLGNVVSATAGAEIDPALTALVGRPVTIAGVPAISGAQPLSLSDFAATAGAPNSTDQRRYRTLTPDTDTLSANALVARPVFNRFDLSLNANLAATNTHAERGLPGVRLQVPAGDPFSPFTTPVEVDRYTNAPGVLQWYKNSWSGHLGAALNGDVEGWRVSATSTFDHEDVIVHSDAGADDSALQALLQQKSATLDPFRAPLFLPPRPADSARSRSDAFDVNFVASGSLFRVPAGQAYASLRLGDAQTWLAADADRQALSQSDRLARNDFGARASLDVPVLRGEASKIGDLWLNGHVGVDQTSRFGALNAFGYGANWTPTPVVNLIVSYSHSETAPTLHQLGDPQNVDRAYVFDYATGQTVEVRQLVGGDPRLVPEHRNQIKVGLKLDPLPSHDLIISATYVAGRTDNPIETFPAATNAIQQAFPSRFRRDASGKLVEMDVSPVNFAQERRRQLRWGLNYSRHWGGAQDGRRALQAGPAPSQEPEAAGGAQAHHFPRRTASLQGTSVQFALYHTVYFEDAVKLAAPGGPIDFLDGAPTDALGGRSRHEIEAQAGVTHNGLGARLSANWRSDTSIRDMAHGAVEDLTFSEAPKLDLRLFVNFDGQPGLVSRHSWLRGGRLTLSIIDALDSRVTVRSASGATPFSYQSAILEPAGRVVQVSFHKQIQ